MSSFFRPALRSSVKYCRGTGFFSSSLFEMLGKELKCFLEQDGQLQIVTSVKLNEDDFKAMQRAYDKQKVLSEHIDSFIEKEFTVPISDGAMVLAKLIELGRLEFKIAVPTSGGMYHVKVGYFQDAKKNRVSWNGSPNDSATAWEMNFEEITVYTSWESNRSDYEQLKHDEFHLHWENDKPGLDVYKFSKAAEDRLIQLREKTADWKKKHPPKRDKWRHQQQAIDLFLADREPTKTEAPMPAGRQGILAMATGTGKTRTAIQIIDRMFDADMIDQVVITTHLNDVLSQWEDELYDRSAHKEDIIVYNHRTVDGRSVQQTSDFELSTFPKRALICGRQPFTHYLVNADPERVARTLLVVDECHNFRGEGHVETAGAAYEKIPFKLGLSATPYSPYSDAANTSLVEQVGPTFFRFGIEEAIRRQILCPFEYTCHDYRLSPDEKAAKLATRRRFEGLIKEGRATLADMWTQLSRTNKLAEHKVEIFRQMLNADPSILRRCIIFVLEAQYGDKVAQVLQEYGGEYATQWRTYYGGADVSNLEDFRQSRLECLITCKKLNEGVDIPSVQNIIMFANDQGRDGLVTTQRIGRALRFDPTNPSKVAHVVDFAEEGCQSGNEFERRAWLTELSAVKAADELKE